MNEEHLQVVAAGEVAVKRWRALNKSGILDLSGADLEGVNLAGVDLSKAQLCDTNLCRANLRGANLREANLQGAKLSFADLAEADLSDALLEGADLTGAILARARFENTDLLDPDSTAFSEVAVTETLISELARLEAYRALAGKLSIGLGLRLFTLMASGILFGVAVLLTVAPLFSHLKWVPGFPKDSGWIITAIGVSSVIVFGNEVIKAMRNLTSVLRQYRTIGADLRNADSIVTESRAAIHDLIKGARRG